MLRQWHCEVGKAGIVILTKSQKLQDLYQKILDQCFFQLDSLT